MQVTVNSESYGQGVKPHKASKLIDWRNSSDRKWLMNHITWAMHNKVSVTMTPES